MKKHKNKIIAAAVIAAVLAIAFLWGGNAPGLSGRYAKTAEFTEKTQKTPRPKSKAVRETSSSDEAEETFSEEEGETELLEEKPQHDDNTPMTAEEKIEWAEQIAQESFSDEEESEEHSLENDTFDGEDEREESEESVTSDKPSPIDPKSTVISDKEMTCTLSVRCDTILNNISWLDEEKRFLVPSDGVIFAEQTVTFYEGESVFNLLMREMKKNKIHMEYTNIPVYNSAYIEGINNIYELDLGELSGWMYKVNGWYPNYGCSRCGLHEGDKVEVVYTCDLGVDVGGYYSARNGK